MLPALANRRPLAEARGQELLSAGEVYRRHAQAVARWASRLGGPELDVEEVVQEVFMAVHRKLPGFRGDASLTTWLFRITENVVHHRQRREKWRRWLSGTAEETAGDVPSETPRPDEAAETRAASQQVYRVLHQLKEKYRTVLVLFELEGLSGDEVASMMGAKTATVWVWLHRARAEFAKRLAELEAQEGRPR